MRVTLAIMYTLLSGLFYNALPQQVSFMKYTMHDGLVANPIRCIYQDSRGFIWIGTFEGLSRYDGFRFTNFTTTNGLSHNFINSIYEIDGKILVAENNGAVDVIRNSSVEKGFQLNSAANYIATFNGKLYISTDSSGLYEYSQGTIALPSQEKTGLALGQFVEYKDSLLVGDGVDNNFFIFSRDLQIYKREYQPSLYFHNVVKDSKNRVWVCSSNGLKLLKVPIYKDGPIRFETPPIPFNIPAIINEQVTSIIEEEDGGYWIGTLKGLIHLFPGGGYQLYNEKDGLPSATISALYRDREKNIWIGTALGLAKWVSRNNVVYYNTEYGDFKNDVSDIHHLSGNKFLLYGLHGLQQFDFVSKEFKDVQMAANPLAIPVSSTPNQVFLPNSIGVYDHDNNSIRSFEKVSPNLPSAYIAIRHPSGIFFVATGKGFFAVRNSIPRRLSPHRITSLIIDSNGDLWMGTWQTGLSRIIVKNSADSANYLIEDKTHLIGQREIRSLFADSKSNIWVGTRYGGAYRLRSNGKNGFDTLHFTRQSGLMSDWVKSFGETSTGDIWVGTYLGLDRLVKNGNSYRVFNFSKATNFFAQIEKVISPGNNTWLCIANTGLAYFRDEALHETHPLKVTILSASLGVLDNQRNITLPEEKITLNPNQNTAHFEFSALGFTNEKQIMYSYRLRGSSDTSWSAPANVHEASYASLSSGQYHFEVKTIGWNGEDGQPVVFSFYIRTPFWKQSWFVSLCIVIAGVIVYLMYKYRIRQILRLQNVRNSIATDLHDDIGSSLTNISILSELTSKHLSQPEKARPFLSRISEEVQTSNQAMDDIIWSVNSHNDSIHETMARMRRYAAELFDNSEINCHLDLDRNDGNKKLSMEQRRDLYLIYKEALNNIHKHAEAKNVWIDVWQNQNHLQMQLRDDGKGFDTGLTTHRNGLKNLRSRVEKWNGQIQIHSGKNEGTSIHIKMPLKD